jgi:DNA mismatch endonuclease (patch repair protein)
MTPEQRSYCMSRIKGKDTSLELRVRSELHRRGLRFRKNWKGLPGKPDVVFTRARLAVFLDGDFWHGRLFSSWKGKLKPFWLNKITRNRKRDEANRRKIRRMGWKVLRIWEHDVNRDLVGTVGRIVSAFREAAAAAGIPAQKGAEDSALAPPAPPVKPRARAARPKGAPARRKAASGKATEKTRGGKAAAEAASGKAAGKAASGKAAGKAEDGRATGKAEDGTMLEGEAAASAPPAGGRRPEASAGQDASASPTSTEQEAQKPPAEDALTARAEDAPAAWAPVEPPGR